MTKSGTNDHREFFDAVQNGDVHWVRRFLDPDAPYASDVNAQNEVGETALMLAASHDRWEVVPVLLERGANLNIKDHAGRTALSRAEKEGHLFIARRLIAAGAFPEWLRESCPCCGYPTLSERGGYDICCLCNWEDDGQDDPHADEVWGGPNGRYSLTEARQNFRTYWVMYRPDNDKRIGGGDSDVTVQAKQDMTRAFDALRDADEPEQARLWLIVRSSEATLRRELKRKLRDYVRIVKRKSAAEVQG